jgi:hypothetical protein
MGSIWMEVAAAYIKALTQYLPAVEENPDEP